jgi:NAD-dependent deacetylase
MDQLKTFGINSQELTINDAASLIQNSKHITVLTGAGISAESGIMTFRDHTTDALWDRFDPAKLASMDGFKEDPQLVWDWYGDRIGDIIVAQPNKAHLALAKLAAHRKVDLFTQNIDDLHERAGSVVTHFHGDMLGARCFQEHEPCNWQGMANETISHRHAPGIPGCPECTSIARPNVVWFGEMLDSNILKQANNSIHNADLIFVIGTSGVVEPVASLVYNNAKPETMVISVNKRVDDHLWHAGKTLTGRAGDILSQIVDIAFP